MIQMFNCDYFGDLNENVGFQLIFIEIITSSNSQNQFSRINSKINLIYWRKEEKYQYKKGYLWFEDN